MMDDNFPLDQKYRDRITGFDGTAVARTEYLSGTMKVCLERGDVTHKSEEMWVDTQRLEAMDDQPPVGFKP